MNPTDIQVALYDIDKAPACSGDSIDSRDIIERLKAYTALIEALELEAQNCTEPQIHEAIRKAEVFNISVDEDVAAEFIELRDLNDEATSDDWANGVEMVADPYFEEYAEQLADDIGAINKDGAWPANHIDWEAAAAELQQDYSSVKFRGVTYWVR